MSGFRTLCSTQPTEGVSGSLVEGFEPDLVYLTAKQALEAQGTRLAGQGKPISPITALLKKMRRTHSAQFGRMPKRHVVEFCERLTSEVEAL